MSANDPDDTALDEDELEITPETLEDDVKAPAEAIARGVPLPFGGDLDYHQLRALKLARPVRTIALFGEYRSGKTTLISEIYHAFCCGPFASHVFAGSQTIEGFERRLHPSRLASGRSTEDTARTSSNKDLTYLHLRLLTEDLRSIDLAWADRAGEDYRAITGATDAKDIPFELGASNHIAFLIDGAMLAEASERANVVQRARQSLRKLIDLGVVGKGHQISFVTTKADLLLDDDVRSRTDAALNGLRERCSTLTSAVESISYFETSVRQEAGSERQLPKPYGIDCLLRHWTAKVEIKEVPLFEPEPRRQLDQLLTRRQGRGPTYAK